jgi:hypothetical protein
MLNAQGNRISELQPIAGLPLRTLNVAHNAVTDLAPLQGMALATLACEGNPLRSLAPFETSPPRYFTFDTVTAGDAYLDGVLRGWAHEGRAELVRSARVGLLWRRGDFAALRRLGEPFKGRTYVQLLQQFTFDEARECARRAGGQLPVVESLQHNQFLSSVVVHGNSCWIDLQREADGALRWADGRTPTYTDFPSRYHTDGAGPWYLHRRGSARGSWYRQSTPGLKAGVVLVFDD